MKQKGFNNNQKNIRRKKPLKIYLQQLLMVTMALILLLAPLDVSMFGPKVAHAESIKDVDILERTNISSKMIEPTGTNTFRVNITGVNKRNKHIGGDGNVISLYFDSELLENIKDDVKLKALENSIIKISFDPVDLSVVSGPIGRSISSVTGFVQGASNKVLNVVDKILGSKIMSPFVKIQGIPEYIEAYEDFRHLERNPLKIPDYVDEVPIKISDDYKIATIDFSEQVKNHLSTNVEDIVVETSNNFINSVKNVRFEILPGLGFMSPINKLINGAISALTDTTDKINREVLAPIAAGGLKGLGLSNNKMMSGQVSASMKLRYYDTEETCTDNVPSGFGTGPVYVQGVMGQKAINNPQAFSDANLPDVVPLPIFVLPYKGCATEGKEDENPLSVFANDLDILNFDRLIDQAVLEDMLDNSEEYSDPDTDLSEDDKDEVLEELGIDNIDTGEANDEDNGEDSEATEDADNDEKSDDDATVDADGEQDEDEGTENENAVQDKDESSDDGAETKDASGSSDINLDMDDLEEGIGLFKRILEAILEVINTFLAEEN